MNYEIITKKIHLKNIDFDCYIKQFGKDELSKVTIDLELHVSQSIQVSAKGISGMIDIEEIMNEMVKLLTHETFDHLGSLCERSAMYALDHRGILGVRSIVVVHQTAEDKPEYDLSYELFIRKNKQKVMHQ